MPTYVYECAKCGDEFELYQSFSDEPLKKHPGCGGKVAKVFQPVGIVLKGSGFYKNDSRSGAKRSSTTSSTESKSADGGSSRVEARSVAEHRLEDPTSSESSSLQEVNSSSKPSRAELLDVDVQVVVVSRPTSPRPSPCSRPDGSCRAGPLPGRTRHVPTLSARASRSGAQRCSSPW